MTFSISNINQLCIDGKYKLANEMLITHHVRKEMLFLTACRNNFESLALFLLNYDINVHFDHNRALLYVLDNQNIILLEKLIEHGFNEQKDYDFMLREGVVNNSSDIVKFALQHDANWYSSIDNGDTIFSKSIVEFCIYNRKYDSLLIFLEYGLESDTIYQKNDTVINQWLDKYLLEKQLNKTLDKKTTVRNLKI